MDRAHGHILVVDDNEDVLISTRLLLKRQAHKVSCLARPEQMFELLALEKIDVVLLDMNFSLGDHTGDAGLYWLTRLRERYPELVVILMTAYAGIDLAVSAIKAGAMDFVIKPWHNDKLLATLNTALSLAQSRHDNQKLSAENSLLRASLTPKNHPLIGESAIMRDLIGKAHLCAPTDASVLILGENGSGKELLAREIHARSQRADQIFMAIDMGAIAESLFDAELFGHKKGAFTGALQARTGRLIAANGGTLFLDEIGNLPLHLQVKLLRVLEQRQVTPVGEEQTIDLDVRIIAATNCSYAQLTDETRFRQDLLYRLNTIELTLPPLRDRSEDIPLLIDHYLGVYAQKYQRPKPGLSAATLNALVNYTWPGNVRALRHCVERALVLSTNNYLTLEDFSLAQRSNQPQDLPQAASLNLEQLERNAVITALKKHQGNISHAAQDLGLTRTALYRRMEKYEL
jgi:DNA-binding NtrC family response regulator